MNSRVLQRILAVLVLAVASMAVAVTPANAAPDGWVNLKSESDMAQYGAYLNLYEGGVNMHVGNETSGRYLFTWKGNGWDIVRNWSVPICLDANDTSVYGKYCNQGAWQRWDLQDRGNGEWRFRNLATGKCMESDGRGVWMANCNEGTWQRWSLPY